AEVPVCPALPFPGGGTLEQIDHIAYCLFPRAGGRAPDELDDASVERLGRLAGRIPHRGAGAPGPHRAPPPAGSYAREDVAWLRDRKILPARVERRYLAASERIAATADERMRDVDVHRIHGDLHLGNVLLRDELLHVVDFDDMMVGPAVQDLWLLLPGR